MYLKEKGQAEKLNTPFHFEKEIFIDRFLLENRQVIQRNKPKLKALQKKVIHLSIQSLLLLLLEQREMLNQEILKLKNFIQSRLSVLRILDLSTQYLEVPQQELEHPIIEVDKFSSQSSE